MSGHSRIGAMFDVLGHSSFRVMLAGVGIGFFLPIPDCVGGFLDGWER